MKGAAGGVANPLLAYQVPAAAAAGNVTAAIGSSSGPCHLQVRDDSLTASRIPLQAAAAELHGTLGSAGGGTGRRPVRTGSACKPLGEPPCGLNPSPNAFQRHLSVARAEVAQKDPGVPPPPVVVTLLPRRCPTHNTPALPCSSACGLGLRLRRPQRPPTGCAGQAGVPCAGQARCTSRLLRRFERPAAEALPPPRSRDSPRSLARIAPPRWQTWRPLWRRT